MVESSIQLKAQKNTIFSKNSYSYKYVLRPKKKKKKHVKLCSPHQKIYGVSYGMNPPFGHPWFDANFETQNLTTNKSVSRRWSDVTSIIHNISKFLFIFSLFKNNFTFAAGCLIIITDCSESKYKKKK